LQSDDTEEMQQVETIRPGLLSSDRNLLSLAEMALLQQRYRL